MNYTTDGFSMDMMNGMGMAPDIKGTWISKTNGTKIQVRDSVITGDGMSVMLSDGRVIDMGEFSNEYYQVSDDIYDINGNKIANSPITDNESINYPIITQPTNNNIDIDIQDITPNNNNTSNAVDEPSKPQNITDDMISKVFENANPKPNIKASISLDGEDFPITELKMLVNIFGVTTNDISSWIYNKYFEKEKAIDYIKEYIEHIGITDNK